MNGPYPCVIFAPDLLILSIAKLNSFLKPTNYKFPSSTLWDQNPGVFYVPMVEVIQTSLNPDI